MHRSISLCLATLGIAFLTGVADAQLLGPVLQNSYDQPSDGSLPVLVTYNPYPFTSIGAVDYLVSNVLPGTNAFGNLTVYQLRPVGNNQYSVLTTQTFTPPAGLHMGYHYNLTTPWNVVPGDIYANFGPGVAYSILPPLSGGGDPNPSLNVYYPSIGAPGVGTTITLPSASYPVFAQERDYSLDVHFVSAVPEPSCGVLALLVGAAITQWRAVMKKHRK